MIETIEQASKLHDKYQFEMKSDYTLFQDKKTHYQISTFIFIPASLGVKRHSYSKANIYRDVQNYIRLKTPILILRDFTSHSASPQLAIERITSLENWTHRLEYKERLINSFKFLSAMLKSSIREHLKLIHKRISQASPDAKVHLIIHTLVEEFMVETKKITEKYRSFYAIFNLPNVDEELFAAYKFTNESISLLIEESAVEMYQIVAGYSRKSEKASFISTSFQSIPRSHPTKKKFTDTVVWC